MKPHLLAEDPPEPPEDLVIPESEPIMGDDLGIKDTVHNITDSTFFRILLIIVVLDHIRKWL